MRRLVLIAILSAMAAGCGGAHHGAPLVHGGRPAQTALAGRRAARTALSGEHPARLAQTRPEALVTDESQSLLAVVDLRSRAARLFIGLPGNPQYVAVASGVALVTSPSAGAVTLLDGHPFRVAKVLHGFGAPHVVEITPHRLDAFVTDDARGTLTVIRLRDSQVITTVKVGAQAHHMAASPDQRRLWIALGESARTIVVLDISDLDAPRVIGSFDPGFAAHDLGFSPDGRRVWISAADSPYVTVFRARDHRPMFRVRVGPPPQHVAFAGAYVYLTSGYGGTIEQVSARSGRVLRRARSPYGSFELAAGDGFVTTASLLDGKVAIYTAQLRLLHLISIGPATRDVSISGP